MQMHQLFDKSALPGTIPGMTLAPELLRLLACPRCKGPVALRASGDALGCARCAVAYPVVDGIPVMIPEEALPWDPRSEGGARRP